MKKILVIGRRFMVHMYEKFIKKNCFFFLISKPKEIKNVKYIFKDITKINLLKKLMKILIILLIYVAMLIIRIKKNRFIPFQGTKNAVKTF